MTEVRPLDELQYDDDDVRVCVNVNIVNFVMLNINCLPQQNN